MREYTITDGKGLEVVVLPEKGATVKQIRLHGEDFLYVDEENLASPERPRCGIPFIFPNFSRLPGNEYVLDGKNYHMEIHGFGHTSEWTVEEHTADSLRLSLCADSATMEIYPYAFCVELEYSIKSEALHIEQRYKNLSIKPMHYTYGFHPYFKVNELCNATVVATAEMRSDPTAGKIVPFGSGEVKVAVPEGAAETGGSLVNVTGPVVLDVAPEGRKLVLDFDKSFDQIVLWTRKDFPFLCVEPVSKAGRMQPLLMNILLPGEQRTAEFKIYPELLTN